MCLHYLWKFEVSDWAVNTVLKCAFEWFLSHLLSGRLTHRTSMQLTTPCGVCFRSESVPKSQTSTNWNDASSASGPLWVARLLTVLLKRGVSVYTRLLPCWRRTFWAHAERSCSIVPWVRDICNLGSSSLATSRLCSLFTDRPSRSRAMDHFISALPPVILVSTLLLSLSSGAKTVKHVLAKKGFTLSRKLSKK